eukprot:g3107.t1
MHCKAPESPSAKSHKASEATAATGLVPIADASVEDTGKAAKAKASPKKRQSKARISGEEKAKSPTKRQSKARNSLAQAAAEEDEDGLGSSCRHASKTLQLVGGPGLA